MALARSKPSSKPANSRGKSAAKVTKSSVKGGKPIAAIGTRRTRVTRGGRGKVEVEEEALVVTAAGNDDDDDDQGEESELSEVEGISDLE